MGKVVPLIGGPIGAGTNFVAMRALARYAKAQFPSAPPAGAPSVKV